jgi:hypothetical protein
LASAAFLGSGNRIDTSFIAAAMGPEPSTEGGEGDASGIPPSPAVLAGVPDCEDALHPAAASAGAASSETARKT